MADPKSQLEIWLGFIQALFWPIVVLVGLAVFHKQVKSLLARASSLKLGSVVVEAFQAPSPDASVLTPVKAGDVVDTGFEKFLSESGIRDAVRETGQLAPGEEVYRSMQIFSTPSQTTWLVFSKTRVFCALDDETTRKKGNIVQWSLPIENAVPVVAREKRPGVGLVDIGVRKNWLYSTSLFFSPSLIETEVGKAIAEAGA